MKQLMTIALMLACGPVAAAPKEPPTWTEPITGSEFVALPKGCFRMGSEKPVEPPWDSHWGWIGYKGNLAADEAPKHEACVDQFWMAKMEVSEGDWHKVMGGDAPRDGGKRAKANVTWLQAREFAARLTAMSGGKQRFRLPTEAEWEYACRAGSTEEGELEHAVLIERAWHVHSPKQAFEAQPTGLLIPNAFGLHDMLGNVWEWTEDSYAANGYTRHALYNPKVEMQGTQRVMRGASFRTERVQTRCTKRGRYDPAHTMDSIGMRLVREPSKE